jgi:ribosomal protein S18 acetylase RimI-like enzyme
VIEYRLLRVDETDAAARQHRLAGALIPGFDPSLHTLEETVELYRGVFAKGSIWGAFDGDRLIGHIALEPGWIEHLYVDPDRHGEGIGRALLAVAMHEQEDLRLYTYAANVRARRLYDAAGFTVEEHGSDPGHVDRVPNVLYRWRRGASA